MMMMQAQAQAQVPNWDDGVGVGVERVLCSWGRRINHLLGAWEAEKEHGYPAATSVAILRWCGLGQALRGLRQGQELEVETLAVDGRQYHPSGTGC